MKQTFRLAAIDVDGTLLDSEYKLVGSAEELAQLARRAGLMVCLVSGRPRCGIMEYRKRMQLSSPDITSGGAHVFDPTNDRVILDERIPSEAAHEVILEAREHEVAIFAEAPFEIHFEAPVEILDRTPSVGRDYMVHSQDLLKEPSLQPGKITLIGDPPTLARLEKELLALELPVNLTTSGPRFLEINHKSVDKGVALKALAGYLQVELGGVLAVGDHHNDVSMFEIAGCSVAMGNAPDEVKKKSDLVAPSNDEDGVLWVIQNLLQGSLPCRHSSVDSQDLGGT